MARKWGNCQRKTIRNRAHASMPSRPVAAAQPMTGGRAPGIAPTAVFSVVSGLSGV